MDHVDNLQFLFPASVAESLLQSSHFNHSLQEQTAMSSHVDGEDLGSSHSPHECAQHQAEEGGGKERNSREM